MNRTTQQENEHQYELTTGFYDLAYANRQDVLFYTEFAKRTGGPVLELGCGTGRILIPTASAGIEITGLDLSGPRLKTCRQKIEKLPKVQQKLVKLENQSMVDFKIDKKFKLITIPFRGFQHILDSQLQLHTFKTIYDHLMPDGYLVLDIFNPSIPLLANPAMLEEFWEGNTYTGPDDEQLQVWGRVVDRDYNTQTMNAQEIYFITRPTNSVREKYSVNYKVRYTFRYELEHLLALSGFNLENVYGDFKMNPFGSLYPGDIIMVAKKPG